MTMATTLSRQKTMLVLVRALRSIEKILYL